MITQFVQFICSLLKKLIIIAQCGVFFVVIFSFLLFCFVLLFCLFVCLFFVCGLFVFWRDRDTFFFVFILGLFKEHMPTQ